MYKSSLAKIGLYPTIYKRQHFTQPISNHLQKATVYTALDVVVLQSYHLI